MTGFHGPAVSIVIPSRNRPALLGRCLDAALNQSLGGGYEIIVVDDEPSPETRSQVLARCARAERLDVELRYLSGSGRGPAAARNSGWRTARAEIIAFTDDDCVPEEGWLEAGMRACSPGVSGASGRIVVPLPVTPTDYERDVANLEGSEFATANCFYRRCALEGVQGFDERFTTAWREDADLFFSLLERGHTLIRAPQAVVVHPVRRGSWGISVRQQRKSMFNALLYKKHPRLYRTRIQRVPPVHYYAILCFGLAALLARARCARIVCAGSTAWGLLTARFCVRRLRHTSHAPGHVAEMIVTSILIPPLAVYWRVRGGIRFKVVFL